MLSCFLERNCKVYHASGDADVMIVHYKKAVELARVADTVLVGDDTESSCIVVLSCLLGIIQHIFQIRAKKATMKLRLWNITAVKEKLGFEICYIQHSLPACNTWM